jgi:hypothetical protein
MQNIRFLNRVILSLLNETTIVYDDRGMVDQDLQPYIKTYIQTPIFSYCDNEYNIYERYFFPADDLLLNVKFPKLLREHAKNMYGLIQDDFDEITYVVNGYHKLLIQMPEIREVIKKQYPDFYEHSTRYGKLIKDLEVNSL